MDERVIVCAREWTYLGLGTDARVTICAPKWTLLRFGHLCAGHRVRSGMDVTMAEAWIHGSSYALGNGPYDNIVVWARTCAGHRVRSVDAMFYLAMDGLVIVCAWERTLLWLGHGCAGHHLRTSMDVIMVWAWMRGSSYALGNGCYFGLGMDALLIAIPRERPLLWFGHGCSPNRTHKNTNVIRHGCVDQSMWSGMDVILVWALGCPSIRGHPKLGSEGLDKWNAVLVLTRSRQPGLLQRLISWAQSGSLV